MLERVLDLIQASANYLLAVGALVAVLAVISLVDRHPKRDGEAPGDSNLH